MALAAAQVVDALAARLAPQALGTGGVRTSRLWPWAEAELPAVRVFAADEQVLPTTVGESINQHTLGVDAQYTLRAAADADDAMHALAEAGLALLFAAPLPHGLLQRAGRLLGGLALRRGESGQARRAQPGGRTAVQARQRGLVAVTRECAVGHIAHQALLQRRQRFGARQAGGHLALEPAIHAQRVIGRGGEHLPGRLAIVGRTRWRQVQPHGGRLHR
jgi:hypothetical protein